MSPSASVPNLIPAIPMFSWELALGCGTPEPNKRYTARQFSTPFATYTGPVSICGTLTEITGTEPAIASLRISDPTGICFAMLDERNTAMQKTAAELESPSFIYVLGKMRVGTQPQKIPIIYAETIVPVSKETRNSWIAAAASLALDRISAASPEIPEIPEYKSRILAALETVMPPKPEISAACSALTDEDIIELIHSLYEGKSAAKQKVMDALTAKGLSIPEASGRIAILMENGDIYAPKPDIIKIL